jgi:CBS domain-containing protein
MFLLEEGFRRLPRLELWHPVIGAVAFGLIGLAAPRALGVGYDEISAVLAGKLAVVTVATLVVAKLAAWWISLASGTSGGTLAPLLLISGGFGSLAGSLVDLVWPAAHVTPGAFALVAMAAAFGASIRATFTAIVFLFELTRDYQIIVPLMLASVLAEFVASVLMRESLMTEKLTRRGLRVQGDYEADVLSGTLVADVMTREVTTLREDATVADARAVLDHEGHDACPVVDAGGVCRAVVTRRDLLSPRIGDEEPAVAHASRDVVSVSPDDTVLDALHLILEEEVTHLPVVDDGKLVGICTRTDILQARLRQFEREHLQPGWTLPLGLLRRRRAVGRNRDGGDGGG